MNTSNGTQSKWATENLGGLDMLSVRSQQDFPAEGLEPAGFQQQHLESAKE